MTHPIGRGPSVVQTDQAPNGLWKQGVIVSAVQPDFFAGPRLAGLTQAESIVTQKEEQALIASIEAVKLSPFRFHGWLGRRLTASFGWNHDFDTARFAPTEPIPDWLCPLRTRAARFARLEPNDLVQALLIRYDPGAGIGWHRDRPVFEHVVGISLGAPATMRFRRRRSSGFDRASAELTPRSIYHLSGAAHMETQHSRDGHTTLVDNLPQPDAEVWRCSRLGRQASHAA